MIKLKDFKHLNLKITWKLIDIGYKSNSFFGHELNGEDVINYAISLLENDTIELISELAGEDSSDVESIKNILKHLARLENTDIAIENKKWIVVYVYQHLPSAETPYTLGLIELGDIWASLDFPEDSPHIYQGRANNITPEEYYTPENYSFLLMKHKKWIANQIAEIQSNSRD